MISHGAGPADPLGRPDAAALLHAYPDLDPQFVDAYAFALPYTMTSPERMYALWQAVRHVVARDVPGALVECGVWRGGSAMLMAHALLTVGRADRELWLYDTFAGMPEPAAVDVDYTGTSADARLAAGDELVVARAGVGDVRANMARTGYPREGVVYVEGSVEDTIPARAPDQIAVLRLDTDWKQSTLHELQQLWPRVPVGGVLVVDDYGHWAGARQAVDQYFAGRTDAPLLSRIDYTGRIAIRHRAGDDDESDKPRRARSSNPRPVYRRKRSWSRSGTAPVVRSLGHLLRQRPPRRTAIMRGMSKAEPHAPLRHELKYWTVGLRRRRRTFEFAGRRFSYYVAAYNTTWENERAVELPLGIDALERHAGSRILEVGNVLKHYVDSPHDVVDKYEEASQAFQMDVLDFRPDEPYDLIVSLSTFEHIGFDEEVRDPEKVPRAIAHVTGLLAPGGELLISVPLGYNASLDAAVQRDELGFEEMRFLKRVSEDNRWVEVSAAEAAGAEYDSPFPKGNVLLFGRTRASRSGDHEN